MKILIEHGRVIDPASGRDERSDVAIADGRIVAIGRAVDFDAERRIDAAGCIVMPGLVDLAVRLREPGHEHEGMLHSELKAAAAGGVTSLVCPPDTVPPLDEPGLVEMLKFRARKLSSCRLFPLGALTRGLKGDALTEMAHLSEAGCIGFSQADHAVRDTNLLMRALQYAATFGHTVWLRPQDAWLSTGVAASGAVATRLGLSTVPVAAETVALHTIVELVRATGARVHLCRLSSAAGVDLVRRAKAEGVPITADVNVHSLHLTDVDIGYFNADMRLSPPLRQQADRDALRRALADGTIDALVSDHNPVADDEELAVRRGRAGGQRSRAAAEPGTEMGPGRWRRPRAHAGARHQRAGARVGRELGCARRERRAADRRRRGRSVRARSVAHLAGDARVVAEPGQAHAVRLHRHRHRAAGPRASHCAGRRRLARGARVVMSLRGCGR